MGNRFWTALGVVLTTAMVMLSAFMNYNFGYGLGTTETNARIFGGVSIVAVGVMAVLPLRIPTLPHGAWLCVEEALGLQRFCFTIHLDAVMARAAVESFASASIHALCYLRDGNAEFALVKRQRRRRH
jgi:hypothetical protein